MFLLFLLIENGFQILFGGKKTPPNARKVENSIRHATNFVLGQKKGQNIMMPLFNHHNIMLSNTCQLNISTIEKDKDGATTYTWLHNLFLIRIKLNNGIKLEDFLVSYKGGHVFYEQFDY